MPTEQNDNTRVENPKLILPVKGEIIPELPALLWDADKTQRYRNIQDFYNTNYWGYGVTGNQTNYDPRTKEGLSAILSNLDYAKSNVRNFAENILTAGAAEGVGKVIKVATTPVKIGEGAEAVVTSAPLSPRVTKVGTIPRSEMHLRNQIPGALKSQYVGYENGLFTYTQSKVKILSKDQIAKAAKSLEKIMARKGWMKITHPNLQGYGFTNKRFVVSDLGQGNIGRDWLGRVRLVDFAVETVPDFRLAMLKKGGRIINNI